MTGLAHDSGRISTPGQPCGQQDLQPLTLAGLDRQPSFTRPIAQRPRFLKGVMAQFDSDYASEIETLHIEMVHHRLAATWPQAPV
jgi:hypothetical protein